MRKQLLAVWLPLLILALVAGAEAQSTSTGADTRATVQKVDVMHADDGISVEITARGQVTPKLSTLGSPARVLVTLPNTVAATVQNHISVGSDGVKGVRIGTDGHEPPTTSIVIDLVQACQYELLPGGDSKIIVKLHPAAVKASAKAVAPAKLQTTASTVAPASVGTAVAVSHPILAAESSSVGPVAAPVAAPADDKTSKQTASATNFAFVEPTYQQKKADEKQICRRDCSVRPSDWRGSKVRRQTRGRFAADAERRHAAPVGSGNVSPTHPTSGESGGRGKRREPPGQPG